MLVFVLLILLAAAVLGVLGAVIKVTLVIALSAVLVVTLTVGLGTYLLRRKFRNFVDGQGPLEVRGWVNPDPGEEPE